MADTTTKTAKERTEAKATETAAKAAPVEQAHDAEKVTVKTSGSFMLIDPYNGNEFTADEAKTVVKTAFVSERLNAGQLVEA
jgi:hypothetical protein